jgi:hypothetical protein
MSKTRKNGIGAVILGLIVMGVGYWFFADLAALEVKGGSMKVHSLVKLLYEMGGKYLVLGVVSGVGALIAGFGLRSLLKRETPVQVS